ncbi:flagellar biosynthesis protein FlhB [uncultured Jatrophihabitans sp.]|uniref:EscU/YscU/HrcU family type III secretion system export apparatus switch protein n=1 Tax=uncultured Jatrophihabitans sp. TaxID=1610747 RepID=UPI0035CA0CBD
MSGGGSGEKTEKATPKRLKKARHDGQIANSPEVGAWLGMLAATFLLPHAATSLLAAGSLAFVRVGAVIRKPDTPTAMAAANDMFHSAIGVVVPIAVAVAVVAILSVALQGGLWFAPGLLKPKFKRLNPLSGIKRMFGPHGAWQLAKSLLKTVALAAVVYLSVRHLIPTVLGSGSLDLSVLVHTATATVLNVLRSAAVGGLLMAFVDYAVVRRRNNKQLKMSKQEIKDEMKSQEGDPHIRGQRRSRQLAMARNRMLADVPLADVVVVNPTHVSVALRYEPERGAPRVVAKGADNIAARIREIAEKNRIPMVSDVPLARTLYHTCDVGQEIPADLFKAVATVLAFIMTLKRRGSAVGTHTVRTGTPMPALT